MLIFQKVAINSGQSNDVISYYAASTVEITLKCFVKKKNHDDPY